MPSALRDARFAALENAAREGCLRSIHESRGMCFQATLALGREACRVGLGDAAMLIRWRVLRDVNFLEHWALVLEEGRVLDMTTMQVDGDPQPLRELAAYPANYVRPRRYPIRLVLEVVDRDPPPLGSPYSRGQLWALHRRMARHDARAARQARSFPSLIRSGTALLHTGFGLVSGYLLERAIARLSRLLVRVN